MPNPSIQQQRLLESEGEPRLRRHPHLLTGREHLSERAQCGAGTRSNRRALPATCDRANHGASCGQPANRFSRASGTGGTRFYDICRAGVVAFALNRQRTQNDATIARADNERAIRAGIAESSRQGGGLTPRILDFV